MTKPQTFGPETSALRVALWRALHVEVDSAPHVLNDTVGLQLAAPAGEWRKRPDMNPRWTATFRASIVARARFIEDLVIEQAARGVGQYVLLGAGLDSFAQRRADVAAKLTIYEVDQPGPQAWKRQRLAELGLALPDGLRFVPVDFEAGESWWDALRAAGFDAAKPAVVVSTGVSMYLTREANEATLRRISTLAPGSSFAMSYMQPFDKLPPEERQGVEAAAKGARANGTPFITFFTPEDIVRLALECGFKEGRNISGDGMTQRYFAGRSDGLRASNGEQMLVATT